MKKAIKRKSHVENVYLKKKNSQVFESVQKTEKLFQQALQRGT